MGYPAGTLLGPYRILSHLASGGMGEVYRAVDTRLGRSVAVKVLTTRDAGDPDRLRRFEQEARAASALNHPNIVTVHDVGVHEGVPYLVAELLEGPSLRHVLQAGPLPVDSALRYARQIVRGLVAAHGAGIIHRDLKPENIVVTDDGVKILDFGLAKLNTSTPAAGGSLAPTLAATSAGVVLGTAGYMSPEQIRGGTVDERTDIFSLGAIFHEMLTGRRAFGGSTFADAFSATLGQDPPLVRKLRAGVPASFERVISRCLAKDPGGRFASAAELLSALDQDPPRAPRNVRLLVALGGVVVLATIVAVIVPRATAPASRDAGLDAIAVLPFLDLSEAAEQGPLADGITDGLILDLAQIGSLKTLSRTSVMQFKGTSLPVDSIARTLKVDALVEGSLVRTGDRLRLNVKLVQADDGRTRWAKAYEGGIGEVPRIQDEIALQIAGALGIPLAGDERRRLTASRQVDRRAYEAYLRGRFAMDKGGREDLDLALGQFQEAIRIDPDFAPPYVGIAQYHAVLPFYSELPPAATLPRAREFVGRALAVDPDLAEAHSVLAYIRAYYEWDWRGAEAEFQEALRLRPSYSDTYFSYSRFLVSRGRLDEAIRQIDRALELNPGEMQLAVNRALLLYFSRRYDDAWAALEQALAQDPEQGLARWGEGLVLEQQQRLDDAIGVLEQQGRGGSLNVLSSLGHAYAVAGRNAEALSILEEMERRSRTSYVPSYYFALVHAGLDDRDEATRWLEKAYQERSTVLAYLRVDPRFDPLRLDSRFQSLLDRL